MKKSATFEFVTSDTLYKVSYRYGVLHYLLCALACLLIGVLLGFGIFHVIHSGDGNRSSRPGHKVSTNETYQSPLTNPIDQEMAYRREFIRNMTVQEWNDIVREATVTSPENGFWLADSGVTSLQSMNTLAVMGLRAQFDQAREWVAKHFHFGHISNGMYVFHAVTQYAGSLLSNYALTQDQLFLDRAREVGDVLKRLAYCTNSTSGSHCNLPSLYINPAQNVSGGDVYELAHIGALQLELRYLSALTNDSFHLEQLDRIRKALLAIPKREGLYLTKLDPNNKSWASDTSQLFWPSSFFYSYLVKSYLQSGGTDREALQMYAEAMDAVERVGIIAKSSTGLIYTREYDTHNKQLGNSMNYDACNLGAMFALGSASLRDDLVKNGTAANLLDRIKQSNRADLHQYWAKGMTETCHWVTSQTKTGIVPWKMTFDGDKFMYTKNGHISSDLAETYFYMYRLTKDPIYREYAWELARSIYQNARTADGRYRYRIEVDQDALFKSGVSSDTPRHFISATLKYLYLTFLDPTVLPLDRWVFNAFGSPLPIMETK